jgi:drug/metabolite transporter (DMT)-like permease
MLASSIAAVFVVLWSTGFVVARAITPYADPNLFLLARFGGTALIFTLAALATRAAWPTGRDLGKHLLAGALLQGVYLGAGYWAVAQGLSAGVMALLGALQPLATAAVAAPLFGERLSRRGWTGMALGLAGVVLVLEPKLAAAAPATPHGHAPPWLVVFISIRRLRWRRPISAAQVRCRISARRWLRRFLRWRSASIAGLHRPLCGGRLRGAS